MISLFKMDLLRLYKSRSFYACIFAFLFLFAICVYSQAASQEEQHFLNAVDQQHQIGLYTSIDAWIHTPTELISAFAFKFAALIFGIYITLYVCSEFHSGFIKTTCMLAPSRWMISLSKLLIATVISVLMMGIAIVAAMLYGTLWISGFTIGDLQNLISFACLGSLLHLAFFSFLIFIATLTKNKTIGIILVFLMVSGFLVFGVSSILQLLHVETILQYSISQIMLAFQAQTIDFSDVAIIILDILLYQGLSAYSMIRFDL